jgi:DNA repair photolyase
MALKIVPAKRFMTKSNMGNADFAANPFHGCTHACAYCYVKTLPGYAAEKRPWGTYVAVRAFTDYSIPYGTGRAKLVFSSATDCYQPAEIEAQSTRRILEEIVDSNLSVSILTKSDLVLRDCDLLTQFRCLEVGMSIALADEDATWLEPGASAPSKRIAALKALKEAGIRTYAFISPIIPYITDVMALIDQVSPYVDFLMFDTLNLSDAQNRATMFTLVEQHKPDLANAFQAVFRDPKSLYYKHLKQRIQDRMTMLQIPIGYLY